MGDVGAGSVPVSLVVEGSVVVELVAGVGVDGETPGSEVCAVVEVDVEVLGSGVVDGATVGIVALDELVELVEDVELVAAGVEDAGDVFVAGPTGDALEVSTGAVPDGDAEVVGPGIGPSASDDSPQDESKNAHATE